MGNILFAIGNKEKEPILLSAHIDTVPPGKKITIIDKGGVIKTDGSSILGVDNKAAVASIIDAVLKVKDKLGKYVEVAFTVEEEITFKGVNNINLQNIKSRQAYLFDRSAPVGTIVIGAPYANDFNIVISGRSAHAGSEPEKGNSSIVAAAQLLNLLPNGRIDKSTTFNIGKISGGTAGNVVPGSTSMQGDFRSLDKKKIETLSTLLKKSIQQVESLTGVNINLEETPIIAGYLFSDDNKFFKETIALIKRLNILPRVQVSCAGSEANIYNINGIEALNLGDEGQYPHALNEQIQVKELTKLCDLIVEIIGKK